jgi:glycosyltransferase involved in cell wall biosynthesis
VPTTLTDEDPKLRFTRGRIVMLVDNGVRGDSRVQKQAAAAAEAGWEVYLIGRAGRAGREQWRIGGAEVRLIPMPDVLNRPRHTFRRSWRHPLAYPPTGIGEYHSRHIVAWRADLAARRAELVALEGSGGPRLRLRRVALGAEVLAATLRGMWVRLRGGELWRARRDRRRLAGPWDRAVTWFWLTVLRERAWRRLEPRLWEFELAFGRVIDQLQPDIIHANDFYMLPVGARAMLRARAEGRPARLVWDAHELLAGIEPRVDTARWRPAHLAYEREYARYTDATITVSDELADVLQRDHRLPERPTVVLNAPVVAPQAHSAPSLRDACGVDPDTPLLVYSGGAVARRGLDIMVDALPQMPDVHVAFVVSQPGGMYVKQLLARATSLGVLSRVHVTSYVEPDQVVAYLSSADVGVIPIHHWPNHEIALITKFFEYAQARLPMVVSDVRAMSRTTRELGQGEVFRATDLEDYVRAVKLVLAERARYRAAYDRPGLLEEWTWRSQAEILDAVYTRLAPARPRRRPGDVPDVSAIMAIRNGMADLSATLDSLLRQTLGLDCIEVIAVDGGSSDGSGQLLDQAARQRPATVRVIHPVGLPSGPEASHNLGLDMARGRYVMLVGAGDHLWPEALERMVRAADEYGSDVLVVSAGGTDAGRLGTEPSAQSRSDASPYAVEVATARTAPRLFRRELIERHGLRLDGEFGVASGKMFALAAGQHAARVSVLADPDHLYAVDTAKMPRAASTALDRMFGLLRFTES